MTLEELIQDCKARVAEEDTSWFTDEDWVRWLNEGQRAVVRNTKILERVSETMTIPGQSRYPMASDFWLPRLVMFNRNTLRPSTIDNVERAVSRGTPCSYMIWGGEIVLNPSPASTQKLIVYYYAWPCKMVESTDEPEIPEAFHGALVTYAVYRARQADQKLLDADRLYAEFQNNIMELMDAYAERQVQGHRVRDVYVVGSTLGF